MLLLIQISMGICRDGANVWVETYFHDCVHGYRLFAFAPVYAPHNHSHTANESYNCMCQCERNCLTKLGDKASQQLVNAITTLHKLVGCCACYEHVAGVEMSIKASSHLFIIGRGTPG